MFKKFAISALVIATSSAALAVNVTPPATATTSSVAANSSAAASLNDLNPSAGRSGKVNWDSLSRAQKIQLINQRHDASVAKANAKWKSLTDDQKLAQAEKRHQRFAAVRQQKNSASAATTTAPATLAPAAGTPVATAPAQATAPVKQ